MITTSSDSAHRFHIPVMGTGFTIDTPLKVAKYGISSVVSLCDHILIERIRKYHCAQNNISYEEIPETDRDARAKSITAYLNLLDQLVNEQSKQLRLSNFEPGSEISKYFEMLPESELYSSFNKTG